MKKHVSFLMILFLLLLTACSGNSESSGTEKNEDGGEASGEEVTLSYAIWDKNQAPAMESIAEKFTEQNPNIKVKVEVTPWDQYWTKLETAAAGGSLPDLFWLNASNIQKYAKGKVISPITEYGADTSVYPQALVDTYTVDGELYALPKDYDTIGLWYNKELFDAAGLTYPDDTWTWDTVIESAKKLTNEEEGVFGFAAALENQSGFYNTVYQAGGYIVNDEKTKAGHSEAASIKGLKFFTDMIHEHKVSPTQAQMTDTPAATLFESGKVAMMFAGSWMQIQFAQNEYTRDVVDVTVLPQGEKRAVLIHGLGNVVAANTKHPEEAAKFSLFLGSEEAHKIQAETGTVIPAYEGTQEAWVQSNENFNLQVFIDSAEFSVPYPATIETRKWQQIDAGILTKAWAGEISIEEAAKQIAEGTDEVLSQEK